MIGMLRLVISALALSSVAIALAPAAAKQFTAKIMASLDRVDDPRVSPDGRYVLYSLRTVDFAANKATMSLWIADLNTHSARRLAASSGGANNGRWSPDGKSIYFISGRTGVDQVFRTDLTGKKAVQVTTGKLNVGAFRIAPNGKVLVISLSVFPDCHDLDCTRKRNDARKANKATGVVYDRLFVRHWDTWADGTRNHLYALTLNAKGAAGRPVALMNGFDGDVPSKPFGDDADFAISPDSKFVAFSANVGRDEAWTTNFDVYLVPIDGSKPPQI